MNLNADENAVLHCTRSRLPYLIDYFMNGKPLPTHEQHQYLGLYSNTPITFMVRPYSQYHQRGFQINELHQTQFIKLQ